MKPHKGIIENWEIRKHYMPMSMVLAPTNYLVVYGIFEDRGYRTSEIVGIKGDVIETRNSYYKLGDRYKND